MNLFIAVADDAIFAVAPDRATVARSLEERGIPASDMTVLGLIVDPENFHEAISWLGLLMPDDVMDDLKTI